MVAFATNETARAGLVVAPGTFVILEAEGAKGPLAWAGVSLSERNEQSAHTTIVRDVRGSIGPVSPGTFTVTVRGDRRNQDGPKSESTAALTGEPEQVLRLRMP